MIRFFFESLFIYSCLKLCIWLRLFTWSDLREFGAFCGFLFILFVLSKFSILLRDKLYPNK